MNRDQMLRALTASTAPWDFIIIGGGATGLGTAVDAAARGYRTLLLEQSDFAKGTSSRSTKLIHGGVRYLQQGNLKLVRESLRERGLLTRNAPHLVNPLAFIVPNYTWWEGPFYGAGLKLYDTLAGKLGLGPSRHLSRKETMARLPTLEPKGLRGGTIYYDGQFDDARLAITLAQTAVDRGATVINYMQVASLLKKPSSASPASAMMKGGRVDSRWGRESEGEGAEGSVSGVVARDLETGREYELAARVVVNATGVFADAIRRMDDGSAEDMIAPSQGAHIVLDRSFLPGASAIMVPKTDDGRVLFAIPWHNRVLVGTTESAAPELVLEPRPLREEIDFLLEHAGRYLTKDPKMKDVLSAFAGLRPLIKTPKAKRTALVPRDHLIVVSKSGLVTVAGGKWTTYRKMAEEAVDRAAEVGGLPKKPCPTAELRLHGWVKRRRSQDSEIRDEGAEVERLYGSDGVALRALQAENPAWGELLHPDLPYRAAQVIWAVRHEMARTVEDVLSRRTRLLLLDARASMEIAPKVARWMAKELGWDEQWETEQVNAYRRTAGFR
jgi:glycerol-3-phosphate dehydrogenase